jgi:hypothetical protein
LLNTCNPKVAKNFLGFCDFIKLESKNIADLNTERFNNDSFEANINCLEDNLNANTNIEVKAIVDRQCACEISNIIGFDRKVVKSYETITSNSICRNLEIKSPTGKLKSRKILLSNIFSVISKSNLNGIKNVYTQGNPDLLLDFCDNIWNGNQVHKLCKNQKYA